MKIAISATGTSLDQPFDPRFGRAGYYIVYDTETKEFEGYPNPGVNASGGAGIQAAQFISQKGAEAVISGAFGPNASHTLSTAGITMYVAPAGENMSVSELISHYQAGQLQAVTDPTSAAHSGMGGGSGRGMGRGMGGGRGGR